MNPGRLPQPSSDQSAVWKAGVPQTLGRIDISSNRWPSEEEIQEICASLPVVMQQVQMGKQNIIA